MPFASSRRYLGQRCFHSLGNVELCLSVFDIIRHNAHLRKISRPSKLLLRKMRGLTDFGFLGSFTRTQTARSQARKQTQIWLRCTRRCKVAFESSSWRSLDLEKGHWTITKRSQRIARYRTLRLSARHSLRHVAPVRVSMWQKIFGNRIRIYFHWLPRSSLTQRSGDIAKWALGQSAWWRTVFRMPFECSQRYLGQRCFHNFGHVELCLSVFDINRHNAHLREISRPSKLLLPKMKGLPDFGFLGSLSLEHRPQEVKPGSKHRYDWDIPADTMWPLNPLVGGHSTLKRVTELSQKDSSIWSFNFSGAPAFFHRLSGREKSLASNDYTRSFLTWNLQVECLLKVKTKISTRTIPRIPHMSQSMAWCLKSSHFGWQMLHFWAKICLNLWHQASIDL